MGMPLSKLKDWKKEQLVLKRLPQMRLELKRLQESLDALEKEL
jgi:UDP-3-O-[3-hydroxymyristoyl] glucosamine N-acyltransferase